MGFRITRSNPNGYHEIRIEGRQAADNARVANGILRNALKACESLERKHGVLTQMVNRRDGTKRIEVYYPLPASSAAYVTELEGHIKRAIQERNLAVGVETEYKPAFVRVEGHPQDLEQLAARLRGDERLGKDRPDVEEEKTGIFRRKLAALVVLPGANWQTVQAAEEYIRNHYGHGERSNAAHLVATVEWSNEDGVGSKNPRVTATVRHPDVKKKDSVHSSEYGTRARISEYEDAVNAVRTKFANAVSKLEQLGVKVVET